jgi:DNA-binding transcriptional LysR family regulator
MTAGTFILPEILVDFYRNNPGAHITLTQHPPERALEVVSVGDADLAVVMGGESEFGPEAATLERERLRDEELVLVTAPSSDIPPEVSIADFSDLRFVCSPEPGSLRRAIIDHTLDRLGAAPRTIVLALDHPTAIKTCVQQGIGVALLFRSAVKDELADETLRQVAVTGATLSIPLFLVFRHDKHFAPLQLRLVQYIRLRLEAAEETLIHDNGLIAEVPCASRDGSAS